MADTTSAASPARVKDLTGRVFGLLTVLGYAGVNNIRAATWVCVCDCKKKVTVEGRSLLRGNTRSCGCYRAATSKRVHTTHGRCYTSLYNIWKGILKRCEDPTYFCYANYGGRGITVCEMWHSFPVFSEDVGERPSPKHSLDRIDNSSGYSPENCRWATYTEQARNRRSNHIIEYRGEKLVLAEWAERLGVQSQVIRQRLNEGWSIEKAVTTRLRERAKKGSRRLKREPEDYVTC